MHLSEPWKEEHLAGRFHRRRKRNHFKLVKDADVVCENFKYGSMERMGLTYEALQEINPGIIYASLSSLLIS